MEGRIRGIHPVIFEKHQSRIDASVNFIARRAPGHVVECRYVRRCEREVIGYLSTQTACNQQCKFCWLTTSGQNKGAVDLSVDEIMTQAVRVLNHFAELSIDDQGVAQCINWNFMARGDALASTLFQNWTMVDKLFRELSIESQRYGLASRFKISTIFPKSGTKQLRLIFGCWAPDIYYSAYSGDEAFRKKWMPSARPIGEAIEALASWQAYSHKIPVLHWCVIKGENEDPRTIIDCVDRNNLRCDFNIVRYNPAPGMGEEGDYRRTVKVLQEFQPWSRVQLVDRVGEDVHASCGMFVS